MSSFSFVSPRNALSRAGRGLLKLVMTTSRVLKRDDGQGLTEYALIVALTAIVSITAVGFLGGRVTTALSSVGSSVSSGSVATTVTQPAQTTTTATTPTTPAQTTTTATKPGKTKKHG
jgi:Flp pilus assembly pilin Flp